MKKKPLMMLFAVMVSFLLAGCAAQMAQTPTTFKPFDLNPPVKAGQYVQKVNTFLVILDASGYETHRRPEGFWKDCPPVKSARWSYL
jgi:hypothetical protein